MWSGLASNRHIPAAMLRSISTLIKRERAIIKDGLYASLFTAVYFLTVCGLMTAHVWESEDNLWESISFHHGGFRDQTHVGRLGGKHPYLMSHLAVPIY